MAAMRAGGELPGVHGLFELRPTPCSRRSRRWRASGRSASTSRTPRYPRRARRTEGLPAARDRRAPRGRAGPRARARRLPARAGLRGLAAPPDARARDGARDRPAVRARLDRPVGGHGVAAGRMIAGTQQADLEAATDDVPRSAASPASCTSRWPRELGTQRATAEDLHRWRTAADRQLDVALVTVEGEAGEELKALEPRIRAGLAAFEHVEPPLLSRTHGDLHWGQFLRSPSGVHVVDFEGEPTRSMDDRRRPASADARPRLPRPLARPRRAHGRAARRRHGDPRVRRRRRGSSAPRSAASRPTPRRSRRPTPASSTTPRCCGRSSSRRRRTSSSTPRGSCRRGCTRRGSACAGCSGTDNPRVHQPGFQADILREPPPSTRCSTTTPRPAARSAT